MTEYNPAPANKRVNEIPYEDEDPEVKMRKVISFLDSHQATPEERDGFMIFLQAHPSAAAHFEQDKMTLRELNGRTSLVWEA